MSSPSERLRLARKNAGFDSAAAAARAMGISEPTYAGHENGSRGIPAAKAAKYARAFKVTPEYIIYGKSDGGAPVEVRNGEAPPEGTGLVPVYDVQASAGHGAIVYDEDHVSSLAFPMGYLRKLTRAKPHDLRIITVKGDSMEPTLHDDDVVMIDTSKHDLSFDGLFVIRDNGEALMVKRIGRASRSGYVTIISDNRDQYLPVERSLADIEVVGRVLWYGRKV